MGTMGTMGINIHVPGGLNSLSPQGDKGRGQFLYNESNDLYVFVPINPFTPYKS